MYYVGLKHLHILSVILFLIIYFIKTLLLISGKESNLEKVTQKLKIPEMIISAAFLLTGILLVIEKPIISKFLLMKWTALIIAIPVAIIAFKKKNKLLAAISYFLLIMTYGFAEMNAKHPVTEKILDNIIKHFFRPNPSLLRSKHPGTEKIPDNIITEPTHENYDILTHGKSVYENNCMMCHGSDGKKGMAGAKDLSKSTLSTAEKITVVRNGRGAMAGYKKVLSEQDIKAVVEYINTFSKN